MSAYRPDEVDIGQPIWVMDRISIGPYMQSRMLADYVRNLRLREDAPMPSELRVSHAMANAIRARFPHAHSATVLQFAKYKR